MVHYSVCCSYHTQMSNLRIRLRISKIFLRLLVMKLYPNFHKRQLQLANSVLRTQSGAFPFPAPIHFIRAILDVVNLEG